MSQTNTISLLPDLNNSIVVRFGDGTVTNDTATIEPIPTSLDGVQQSNWVIGQWSQTSPLNSDQYVQNSPITYDPLYGNAIYSWSSPDTNEAVSIYQNTQAADGGYVYDLTGGNGVNEADLFLSAAVQSTDNTLNHPITLSLNAKITQAIFDYNGGVRPAGFNGGVGGNVDIGFTLNFDGADGLPKYSGFIQIIPMTNSVGYSSIIQVMFPGYIPTYQNDYATLPISANPNDATQFINSSLAAGDGAFPLIAADSNALPETLTYNVNKYAYAALSYAFYYFSGDQASALMDMANWSIGSMYIGTATNNQETGSLPAGDLSLSLQVSDLSLTTDTNAVFNPVTDDTPTAAVDPNPEISFYDASGHIGGSVDGSSYLNGTSLIDKYIYVGSDTLFLTAPSGVSWIFGGGSGTTILAATSGNNTFVASTGSSFMTGGTGDDTFVVPDANIVGAGKWDTIVNFHYGDIAEFSGLAGAGWSYTWIPDSGASGSDGLTLFAQSTKTPGLSELITFSGLTIDDLNSMTVLPGSGAAATSLFITMPNQPNSGLSWYDLSTGASGTETGVYDDTVNNIQAKYIYMGSDNMNFIAQPGSNWEFGGGTAQTAMVATSGNNIFVASSGGSFMTGGSGNDTFVIADANLTGAGVWHTIKNFHVGDMVDLAGLAGSGWTYSWIADTGATGSTGLTLLAQSNSIQGVSELLTFAGLQESDLSSMTLTAGDGSSYANLVIAR